MLFRYFIMKLKMFLGIFCCTVDQRPRTLKLESLRIEDIMKPCDVNSWLMQSSWSFRIAVRTCLVFLYWSYWMLVPLLVAVHNKLTSRLGEDLRAFLMTVWQLINFVKGIIKLIPHFEFSRMRVLKVELIGSSSHCLAYLVTVLSRF